MLQVQTEIIALAAELREQHPGLSQAGSIEIAVLLIGRLDMDESSRYRPKRVVMFEKLETE